MSAEWKDVVGFEGRYLVSDQGHVWSVRSNRLILGSVTSTGYRRLSLYGPDGTTFVLAHRVITEAFIGPCPEGMQVRHLDGNPLNNRLANLAYGTQTENNLDTVRHGTHKNASKSHCTAGHPFDEANTYWRERDGYRHRQCRKCMYAAVRRYQARKAVA